MMRTIPTGIRTGISRATATTVPVIEDTYTYLRRLRFDRNNPAVNPMHDPKATSTRPTRKRQVEAEGDARF